MAGAGIFGSSASGAVGSVGACAGYAYFPPEEDPTKSPQALAIGPYSCASNCSIAMGICSVTTCDQAVVIGSCSRGGQNAVVMGFQSEACNNGVVFGLKACAKEDGISVGSCSTSEGGISVGSCSTSEGGISVGSCSTSEGNCGITIGNNLTGCSNSICIGDGSISCVQIGCYKFHELF